MNLQADQLRLIDTARDEAFYRLPIAVRDQINERLPFIVEIIEARHGEKGELVKAACSQLDLKPATVNRYVGLVKRHGWRGLLDGRKLSTFRPVKVPAAFIGYVQQLYLEFQRGNAAKEIHRVLIERWLAWKRTGENRFTIPGYDSPPPADETNYPAGWSVENIRRMKPDKYELAAARQGAKRSAKFLPSILKTRAGTKFGQVVFFDDQDYDLTVVAPGVANRTLRPQGFNCLDYLSGAFLGHSVRLRYRDIAADQYRTLTQTDFVWFVIHYLQRWGFRRDEAGTRFIFEHGTATGFSNRELATPGGHSSFDDALAEVTGGCVSVHRSGRFNRPVFSELLFRPQSSGNPNFKAPLESMFNLVRNRMALLPGPVGMNREMKPAEQYGLERYCGQLLKIYEDLPDNLRDMIQWPTLTAMQFGEIVDSVYGAIDARTDHKLEGWAKCGFVQPAIRFAPDQPWLHPSQVEKLTPEARQAAYELAKVPGYAKPFPLSPADVARRHRGELTRLPDHLVPALLPIQWARPARVTDQREIRLQDSLMGPEPFRYLARFQTRDGVETLRPGTPVRCYLNPFDASKLYVCREDGSWLGVLHERFRSNPLDADSIEEQLKERAAMKADLDSGMRPLLEGTGKARQEMKRHNDRLRDGKPVTEEGKAEARREAGLKGARTAAANRLKQGGEAEDFDTFEPDAAASAFDELPDDSDIPENF